MSSRALRALPMAVAVVGVSAPVARGQTDSSSRKATLHVMAQAVPVITRATPTVRGRSITEAYLSQPLVMLTADRNHLHGVATINFEGLTLARGELTTGAEGEGYVDRRHPHTYIHELLVGVDHSWSGLEGSLFAGRGFAPFGSDDPMSRPFQKYPVNHHLAQILERVVTVAALRKGPVSLEGGIFNGDEPTSPTSSPRWKRFGDSWSSRLTWASPRATLPLEVSVSAASVKSPEIAAGGGLNQAKRSAAARWQRSSVDRDVYLLGEWAQTRTESPAGRDAGSYRSWLAEGSVCRSGPRIAARLEQTDRPEEQRLADLFRTPNPPTDNSNNGVTRWTTATVSLSAAAQVDRVGARPFVEVALARPKALFAGSVFDPVSFYGSSNLWMISGGVRLSFGMARMRMGRYGVAAAKPMAMNGDSMGDMKATMSMPMSMPMPMPESATDRCAN